jgi:hypothetical protein
MTTPDFPTLRKALSDARALPDTPANRIAVAKAKADLNAAIKSSLPVTPTTSDDATGLSSSYPFMLLPVRLETRFVHTAQPVLRVRIYPDEIFADTHEQELTSDELAAGTAFWNAAAPPSSSNSGPVPSPDAWRTLLSQYPAPRATWIAQATKPGMPTAKSRASSWTRAAEAVLPDRWTVIAYRSGVEQARAQSGAVTEPLALSLSPGADPARFVDVSGDGFRVDPDMAWMIDFAAAQTAGMAVELKLSPVDASNGFDLVIAIGVKGSFTPDVAQTHIGALLEAHHYTRGLAFVAQGTPTSNSGQGPSGFPPPDPNGVTSFAVELMPPAPDRPGALPAEQRTDGAIVERALGLKAGDTANLAGTSRREQAASEAMLDVLWPATLGYFLDQMMAPEVTLATADDARDHARQWVRGRGPLPAFRIGSTPYALLPVTSLSGFQARKPGVATWLPGPLAAMRDQTFVPQTANVARVQPGSKTPDADLIQALELNASAQQLRVCHALGPQMVDAVKGFGDAGALSGAMSKALGVLARLPDVMAWAKLGVPVANALATTLNVAEAGALLGIPFVSTSPLSEIAPTTTTPSDTSSYLGWLLQTAAQPNAIDTLKSTTSPPGGSQTLLFMLLRHALLNEFERAASDVLIAAKAITPDDRRETELVGWGPTQLTAWNRMTHPLVTGHALTPLTTTTVTVAPVPHSVTVGPPKRVQDYLNQLATLQWLPTAELQRLLTETLDLCAHRLDAWITSMATQRLEDLRSTQASGTHFGAYGWVEQVRPSTQPWDGTSKLTPTTPGGFIHAPSPAHASAAAVLRNGYLTRDINNQGLYSIDLSSARVRTGLALLDEVRQGNSLSAALGYRLEHALKEPDPTQSKLIAPLRTQFPPPSGSPRDVVDGLAVLEAWRIKAAPFATPGDPNAPPATIMQSLDQTLDALTDLLTAEGVFQAVKGNTTRAAATLDSLAQGTRPPDPEFAQTPRRGIAITHRVAIVLGSDATPLVPAANATPRQAAEPYLDRWVGSLLGDLSRVTCQVSCTSPTGAVTKTIAMSDLGLAPLDVVALAKSVVESPRDSELDRRVTQAATKDAPGITNVQITYAAPASMDRTTRNARSPSCSSWHARSERSSSTLARSGPQTSCARPTPTASSTHRRAKRRRVPRTPSTS